MRTEGSELSRVMTRPRIPCSEFNVLSGRKIRMTLMAEMFRLAAESDTQPRITTEKSSYNKQAVDQTIRMCAK